MVESFGVKLLWRLLFLIGLALLPPLGVQVFNELEAHRIREQDGGTCAHQSGSPIGAASLAASLRRST